MGLDLGSTPVVRHPRADEYPAMARVWYDSWISTGLARPDDPQPAAYVQRLEEEGRSGWQARIAVSAPGILGFLAYDPSRHWLRQLFIAPHAQRQGIGRMLLDHAKHAMPGGFWLRTDAGNVRARQFYGAHDLRHVEEARHPQHGHLVAILSWRGALPDP